MENSATEKQRKVKNSVTGIRAESMQKLLLLDVASNGAADGAASAVSAGIKWGGTLVEGAVDPMRGESEQAIEGAAAPTDDAVRGSNKATKATKEAPSNQTDS
eukprot:jgi/Psemu1/16856/gm1.16856_g